jgi:hypothetical protein
MYINDAKKLTSVVFNGMGDHPAEQSISIPIDVAVNFDGDGDLDMVDKR